MSRQQRRGEGVRGNGCMIKAQREQHKYLLNKLNWPWVICMCRTNGNSLGPKNTEAQTEEGEEEESVKENNGETTVVRKQTADVRPDRRTLDNEPMTRKPKLKEWPGAGHRAACATAQPCLHLGYWHCFQTALHLLPSCPPSTP